MKTTENADHMVTVIAESPIETAILRQLFLAGNTERSLHVTGRKTATWAVSFVLGTGPLTQWSSGNRIAKQDAEGRFPAIGAPVDLTEAPKTVSLLDPDQAPVKLWLTPYAMPFDGDGVYFEITLRD